MIAEIKPRQDVAEQTKIWRSIQDGSFIRTEYRSLLQKAIDKNATTVRIETKKEIEEGDLQIFDGTGWSPFNIYVARDLIVNKDVYVGIREYVNGQWIDQLETTQSFNKSFRNAKYYEQKGKTFIDACDSKDWYKMSRQDQDLHKQEGLKLVGVNY